MGTLQDASNTAFRRQDSKRTTDSQAGGEDAMERRTTDGERIAGEENEKQAFEERERTDASSSALPEQSSSGSRHDPGGLWLTKGNIIEQQIENERLSAELRVPDRIRGLRRGLGVGREPSLLF
ncbi:hypothetical protein NDU88_006905 [Pleurodeles waltl]|uniref:Uncharacterized protein n=1 Tax=Pleurodeles waltl TaxID=8319 RepID=A0AAV7QQB0_PLEWA|nr:hypothetical protein NDU88_006905 [Pleurodeles waltl]